MDAIAALEAGKHVIVEKPIANSVEEAERMLAAAEAATARGQHAIVNFNYRRVPAIEVARQLVAEGRIGPIRHVRAAYLQDWLNDPSSPMSWRLRRETAGSGALGDVVADKAYSSCETRVGPSSGAEFTDFSRIGFTITTTEGAKVSVYADRCGLEMPGGAMADGGMMYSSVSKLGIVQSRDIMPDKELEDVVAARAKAFPDYMPYFHLQHDDYITLKERCCAHIANGAAGAPEGIATVQVACDTLKLAETLKPLLEKQLL